MLSIILLIWVIRLNKMIYILNARIDELENKDEEN